MGFPLRLRVLLRMLSQSPLHLAGVFLFKFLCEGCPPRGPVGLWLTFSFPATENPAELRPKNTLGGQLNESMFLLRYVKGQSGEGSPAGGCKYILLKHLWSWI